jgi:hypothetical protein
MHHRLKTTLAGSDVTRTPPAALTVARAPFTSAEDGTESSGGRTSIPPGGTTKAPLTSTDAPVDVRRIA